MKEITVLSGKGGTGKTSITAALASLAGNAVFCDNDVDAADLHLILQPGNTEEHQFFSGYKASIDVNKCTSCNLCLDHCRFDAIHLNINKQLEINAFQCEGCRLCERICPSAAITSERNSNNFWYVANTRFGKLVHARMGAGEENSGKLVTQVRKRAREIAKENNALFIVNDGPPGIGCAAISSLSGADRVLMVIEPTRSGLQDAQRLVELIRSFKTSIYAVINKYDINLPMSLEIEDYLQEQKIALIARIPFDRRMVEAMTQGKNIVEYSPHSEIAQKMHEIWQALKS
jgi:MinD superfamily P-loop ATPase